MLSSIEIQKDWVEDMLTFLKDSNIYTKEEIMESKNPDCVAMRSGMVCVLQSFGLTDTRICRVCGLTSGQVYRSKQHILDYTRENNVYFNRLTEMMKKIVNKKIKEQEIEWMQMMEDYDREHGLS